MATDNLTSTPTLMQNQTAEPALILSLNNVEVIYDHVSLAIKGVSIDVPQGAMVALLGANGAGKSTLLHLIARQLVPVSGTISIDATDIANMGRRELAQNIAMMPQHEDRHSQLRVIDVVSLGRTPHCGWWRPMSRGDHDIVHDSLDITGLWELRERLVHELSGGEWRRMILARSLAQRSPILLLDEPTAGLDLKYQLEVLTRIRTMTKQRNLIGVVTLHDLNHASVYGDRVALLSGHSLIAIGTPAEVLKPELIEQAFGLSVSVLAHPVHGTPFIVPRYECIEAPWNESARSDA